MRVFTAVVLCSVYFYASIWPRSVFGYEVRSLASDGWAVKNSNNSIRLHATVPSGIYTDLFRAGVLHESIYRRFNDVKYRWVAYENWTYSIDFTVEEVNLVKKYELVFHGLDGHATILLNNRPLGKAENTFVRYRFDVTRWLNRNKNTLLIWFESPIASGRRLAGLSSHSVPPNCVPSDYRGECHVNYLRRMPASYGWDWGLAAPSVGIWKDIELVTYEQDVRIRDVRVSITKSDEERWRVRIAADCETAMRGDTKLRGEFHAMLTVDGGEVQASVVAVQSTNSNSSSDEGVAKFNAVLLVQKTKVKLWWPNGYGEQPLYNLTVAIKTEHSFHTKTVFVGFREATLVQDYVSPNNITAGRNFYFAINGVPIFAKGTNYIPHSIFLEEAANNETIISLLSAVREANMNMVRIWGGGIYADDLFYEECDRLGIMVWQDMMFACSMYPADSAFLANVRTEIGQQIARLQYHPSIVVWAGNNENEAALRDDWYGTKNEFELYRREYVELYVNTVKKEVLALDDTRPFLVSSPTNGVKSEAESHVASNPYDLLYGDIHFYRYTMNTWVVDDLQVPRFASEYGAQALPSLSSLRQIAADEDLRSLNTDFFLHRQHLPFGYGYLVFQMLMQFSAPKLDDMNNIIYLSQVNQAWGVKQQTEWYRRSRSIFHRCNGQGKTMGAMYWQLNDVWQAPSWSSIEFGGKWKMLHYYAKKFFAPVIVTAHLKYSGQIKVSVVSDLLHDLPNTEFHLAIFRWTSWTPIHTTREHLTVRNQSAIRVLSETVEKLFANHTECCESKKCFIKVSLTDTKNGELIHENFVFPRPLREVDSIQPSNVQVDVKSCNETECTLDVSVNVISLFVWLDANDLDGHFSENGFIMTEPRKSVQFYPRGGSSISVAELRAALSTSVLDSRRLNTFSDTDSASASFINRFFRNAQHFNDFRYSGQY